MSIEKRIGLGVLSFCLLMFTYVIFTNLVSIPREKIEAQKAIEQKKIDDKLFQTLLKESSYADCKKKAFDNYSADWDNACELAEKEADCSLKIYLADRLNESRDDRLDTCLEIYKAN